MARRSRPLYVATSSGVGVVDGVEYPFQRGVTHVREGHPLLGSAPMYFELAEDRMDYGDDERAVADPGVKRGEK